MTYAMRLNGGDLIRDGEPVKHDGFTVTVMREGTRFGNGEPLVKTLNTLMTNGSWEKISRLGNRPPALGIKIEGETPDGLNAGGVWLSKLMRPGELEWLPPDQTVWTVFDVVRCHIELTEDEGWDLDETKWIRRYRIPIKALPHARSRSLTITAADVAASEPLVDELVDDGSSATGWSARWQRSSNGGPVAVTTSSGQVRATHYATQKLVDLCLRSSIDELPAETPYLRVDVTWSEATPSTVLQTNLGTLGASRAIITGAGPKTGILYFRIPSGVTWFEVKGQCTPNQTAVVAVDQVRRLSRLPIIGTNRQQTATLTPGGSAPAEGSLHVGHDTDALGKGIVHTYPLGRPSPALMEYRTASTTPTPDDTQINGERVLIQDADLVLTVPDPQLPTHGRAALWAKVRVDTAPATVTWTVTPTTGGVAIGQVQTKSVVIPAGASQLVPLGLVNLPGAETGSDGATVVTLRRTAGSGVVSVDEVWPFGQDEESALTIVDAGTGTPAAGGASNHLWINAPTAEKPAGEVLIGTSLTNARWPSLILAGPEVHRFGRDGVAVLVVTTSAAGAATDLTHFKRWDHFAAEES